MAHDGADGPGKFAGAERRGNHRLQNGQAKKDADAKKDLQLSMYAMAGKEIFEWNPVRLVFHYLQDNQLQETTRDAKQLDEAQRIVQETAADIRAGEFPRNRDLFAGVALISRSARRMKRR